MRAPSHFHVHKLVSLALILIIAPFLNSCVVTEGYYGESTGSYYGEPGYSSGYHDYGHRPSYRDPYYRNSNYRGNSYRRHDSHRYDARQYKQRDSRVYHANAGRDHRHKRTTTSDKIRLVNYREDKKKSHPSGYHDADYWKSRGYSVKKNTFEKKDGKIVGSRKDLKRSKRH